MLCFHYSVYVCVCVCRLKYFCFRIAAWYFWLVMLNMWQSSWKADLSVCLQVNVQVHQCPSATASVFSPSVRLTAADTHAHAHMHHSIKYLGYLHLCMLVAITAYGASSIK